MGISSASSFMIGLAAFAALPADLRIAVPASAVPPTVDEDAIEVPERIE